MQIFIATANKHKEPELSKYFKNIGLKTTHIYPNQVSTLPVLHSEYICVREQTTLTSKESGKQSLNEQFEEVVHNSTIQLDIYSNGEIKTSYFSASVDGMIFPNLRTNYNKEFIFGWDDIFVSSKTMKTYQYMKDKGLKNSARDIAFSKMIEQLPHIFQYNEKINLNFNPVSIDEVISFDPFIKKLFDDNKYYNIAYKNPLFKNIINNVLNDGLFIRRASDRKQRNYWLPGLNAGIPLTPKKDELHELTFMFHDIMHFIFPDLIVVDKTEEGKRKYIISRMMSEAFTIVLADMLFISLLSDNDVQYDYDKRKIYPLFKKCSFEISTKNIPKLKELLWANTLFALLGDEEALRKLVGDDEIFDSYKHKYQRFFQEDYNWTSNNYNNISNDSEKHNNWVNDILNYCNYSIPTSIDYCPVFNKNASFKKQVQYIFETMFNKLEAIITNSTEYDESLALSNAIKRYSFGQMSLFYRFDTLYNKIFIQQISLILSKEIVSIHDFKDIKDIYNVYINKLVADHFITEYDAKGFRNIYPMFTPFYVFYDKKENETFTQTLNSIFK